MSQDYFCQTDMVGTISQNFDSDCSTVICEVHDEVKMVKFLLENQQFSGCWDLLWESACKGFGVNYSKVPLLGMKTYHNLCTYDCTL